VATVTMALVPLLWIGGAGASPAIDLQTSVTTMTWAGGRVTLSAFGGPTGTKCLVTAAPTVVISTPAWTCGPGLHTSTAHLPSNDSSHPVHYRFILTPGDLLAEVTVSSADYGGDLRVTSHDDVTCEVIGESHARRAVVQRERPRALVCGEGSNSSHSGGLRGHAEWIRRPVQSDVFK